MHVGIANTRWRGKRSRHSRRMRNFTYLVRGPWLVTCLVPNHYLNQSADLLSLSPSETNFSEININIEHLSFKKMHSKLSSEKCRPFCRGFILSSPFQEHPERENWAVQRCNIIRTGSIFADCRMHVTDFELYAMDCEFDACG